MKIFDALSTTSFVAKFVEHIYRTAIKITLFCVTLYCTNYPRPSEIVNGWESSIAVLTKIMNVCIVWHFVVS